MTGRDRRRAERAGRLAEAAVGLAYALMGYEIVARRFKAPGGEIDLVARKAKLVAFIEVKLRAVADDAVYAVTPKNRYRLERAAASFLALHPQFSEFAVRYDIAAVAGWRLRLVKDAWRARA